MDLVWTCLMLAYPAAGLIVAYSWLHRHSAYIGSLMESRMAHGRLLEDFMNRQIALPSGSPELSKPREIIRTQIKLCESAAWKELVSASKDGRALNLGAAGRREVLESVDGTLKRLERVGAAARLYVDEPSIEREDELKAALKAAHIDSSRPVHS